MLVADGARSDGVRDRGPPGPDRFGSAAQQRLEVVELVHLIMGTVDVYLRQVLDDAGDPLTPSSSQRVGDARHDHVAQLGEHCVVHPVVLAPVPGQRLFGRRQCQSGGSSERLEP